MTTPLLTDQAQTILLVSLILYTIGRLEQLNRKVSQLDGKLCILMRIIKLRDDQNGRNKNNRP